VVRKVEKRGIFAMFVENCCVLKSLKKRIWPKKPILRLFGHPEKAYERASFADKKPKIHQSRNGYLFGQFF